MTRHDKADRMGMERNNPQLVALHEGAWHPAMKSAVARAAFAEVALATGTWSPSQIERTVGRLAQRPAHLEERSNKFRNMLRNGAIPTPATVAEIKRALPATELGRWLHHPIFFLLDARVSLPSFARAASLYAFDSLSGPIRFHLWQSAIDDAAWSGVDTPVLDERARLAILESSEAGELADLDRLILAVAMGRMSALDAQPKALAQAQWVASNCAAEAIAGTPQLLIGWKSLLPALHDFWTPPPTGRRDALTLVPGSRFRELATVVALLNDTARVQVPREIYDHAALHAFLSEPPKALPG